MDIPPPRGPGRAAFPMPHHRRPEPGYSDKKERHEHPPPVRVGLANGKPRRPRVRLRVLLCLPLGFRGLRVRSVLLAAYLTGWAARRGPGFTNREPGPFPRSLPPNPAGAFQRTGLSSDYAACVTGFAWMTSWQGWQTTSVLRRLLAMRAAHAGWPGPGVPSRASLAT
jgi:hypothetical protein